MLRVYPLSRLATRQGNLIANSDGFLDQPCRERMSLENPPPRTSGGGQNQLSSDGEVELPSLPCCMKANHRTKVQTFLALATIFCTSISTREVAAQKDVASSETETSISAPHNHDSAFSIL